MRNLERRSGRSLLPERLTFAFPECLMRIRTWRKSVAAVFLVLGTAGLGACAPGAAGAGGGNTTVRVENNLIPPTSLTVSAVPSGGTRRVLGSVSPNATATLRFNAVRAADQYRLVAQAASGAEIVSNPVTFSPGATVQWDLRSNVAKVVTPD